jgi:hypothetical protein
MKKNMIQGFTPLFCSFNKNEQVLNELGLTGKITDSRGPMLFSNSLSGVRQQMKKPAGWDLP